MAASLRQSLAAALAGLALSHTIARAVWTGFVTRKLGFFRTPKLAQAPALIRAVSDVREESLFLVALWLAAALVLMRDDAYMLDVRVWATVLLVQSLPFLASVLASLISSWRGLPSSLIGTMREIDDRAGHTGDYGVQNEGR